MAICGLANNPLWLMIDMAVLALLGTITVFQRIREVYVSMRANGDAGVSSSDGTQPSPVRPGS